MTCTASAAVRYRRDVCGCCDHEWVHWWADRATWAELVIPALGTVGTFVAAGAAWITSRQALRIARDADRQAQRDATRREAVEQGRLLVEWVTVGRNQPFITRRLDEAEPVEPRRVAVAREAKAALLVSRVPAAQQLLELTEHDFGYDARLRIEDAILARQYDDAWRTRTLQRITSWTQDPWRQQTPILQQHAMMRTAPWAYARVQGGDRLTAAYADASMRAETV